MNEEYMQNELPEPYAQIAETLGIDIAIEIARMFNGECVYFPKMTTVERPLRNRKILEEFNGYNYKTLAKRYGLTEPRIRAIVKPIAEEKRSEPICGQMSLSDYD